MKKKTEMLFENADRLSSLHNRTLYLKILAENAGMTEEAKKLSASAVELEKKISSAISENYEILLKKISSLNRKMLKASGKIEKQIAKIEKEKEVAANIVKAVGLVDEIIKIIAKFAA
jgi:hypothetical protein